MATFLRAAASLFLGLAIVAALLIMQVAVNVFQRLKEPETYSVAVSDTGAYSRLYDEVLVDDQMREQTGRLLGGVDLAVYDEAAALLRQVMPPEYLREQTEANIGRFTAYLRRERGSLELYVSLEEPLERVEPALLGRVDRYVDELEIADPPVSGCSLGALQRLADASAEPYAQLSRGRLPRSAPSLEILSPECREREFDRWFGLVVNNPAVDSQTSQILERKGEGFRSAFVQGDTRALLKAAAGPLVEPLVEDAVMDMRESLPPDGKFDVLDWLASQPGSPTRVEIEGQAEALRQMVEAATGPVRLVALAVVVLGSLLLALVYLPRPKAMLRWPGAVLLTGGAACLIAGLVINEIFPQRVRDAVAFTLSDSAAVPGSAANLAAELAESLARQATGGLAPVPVAVIVVGAVMVLASLYWDRLSASAGRIFRAYGAPPNSGAR